MLKLSIELEHARGKKHYTPPPLRKSEVLASVSGILSNNGLFNMCFAPELDLYVGAGKLEDETAFPDADKDGYVKAEQLATSYGVRTTEDLIEALLNPVLSEAAQRTPFMYYASPTSPSERARTRSPQSIDDYDSPEPNATGDGRRSVDSSMGSGSFVGNTSETWSFDPGMAVERGDDELEPALVAEAAESAEHACAACACLEWMILMTAGSFECPALCTLLKL